MVTPGLQAASAQRAASAARKGMIQPGLRSNGARPSVLGNHSHLSLQQPAWAPADADRRKRDRASVKSKRELKVRGEMKAMLAVVVVFASVCACGVVYLSAYAGVAAQSHQITLLQQELNAAQAQHEVYIQQITILSSATRVQALAKQQGMVMSDSAHYLTLNAGGQDGAAVRQAATDR